MGWWSTSLVACCVLLAACGSPITVVKRPDGAPLAGVSQVVVAPLDFHEAVLPGALSQHAQAWIEQFRAGIGARLSAAGARLVSSDSAAIVVVARVESVEPGVYDVAEPQPSTTAVRVEVGHDDQPLYELTIRSHSIGYLPHYRVGADIRRIADNLGAFLATELSR